MNKELLIICTYFRPNYTGAGIFIEKLLTRLHKQFHIKAKILTIQWSPSLLKEESDWLTIHRMFIPLPYNYRSIKKVKYLINYIFSLWTALYILITRHSDRIITMDTDWSTALASMSAKTTGKAVYSRLTMLKGTTPSYLNASISGRLRLAILKRNTNIILQNPIVYQEYIQSGFLDSQLEVIPNGVDTSLFTPVSESQKSEIRKYLDLPSDASICVYVGGIVPWKGIKLLQDTWQIVSQKVHDAYLILIGPTYPDQIHLVEFTKSILNWVKNDSSVKLLGQVKPNEVPNYLKSADVFLFPSEAEGLPNALLEAMSCGLTCVVTKFLGFSDFIGRDGKELIVSEREPETFASKIVEVLTNNQLRKIIGQNACMRVLEHFSMEKTVEEYCRILELNCEV